jgi:pyridoxine 4-dehydrogenase
VGGAGAPAYRGIDDRAAEVGPELTTPTLNKIATASGRFSFGGDLEVVRLGYGTMQLPGPGVWGPPKDHDEALRVLRRAVEIGITFFDTADSYGPNVAEELLFEALHPTPRTSSSPPRPG